MNEPREITELADIQLLVDTFYGKVRLDPLIGPIFDQVIENRWPEHLEKMYRFWQTILLDEHTYYGHPFVKHAPLPINTPHFEAWLRIWHETLDTLFKGDVAEEAKKRGVMMAGVFLAKLSQIQGTSYKAIV